MVEDDALATRDGRVVIPASYRCLIDKVGGKVRKVYLMLERVTM